MSKYLTDYSQDESKWDNHRSIADDVSSIYLNSVDFRRYYERMDQCTGYLDYTWITDDNTGEQSIKLRRAFFCRVRHCPVCQWRRSMMWQAKFYQALPSIQISYPSSQWLMLTLTVINCDIHELGDTITIMNKAFKKLTLRKEFMASVLGFIRTTEVTYSVSKNGNTHPHFHVLLMVKPSYFKKGYIKHSVWVEMWRSCLKVDYSPNIDIRPIKGDLKQGVIEVLKYSIKPDDMTTDNKWFIELTRQLLNRRFIGTGGVLKDMFSEREKNNDDFLYDENNTKPKNDEELQNLLRFGWSKTDRRYKKVNQL